MAPVFEEMIRDIEALGLNLYDLALYTDGKIQAHQFQPCNNSNNSYSVAKAFVVTAIGLLWEKGALNVTDSLYMLFRDQFPPDADPAWRLTTIEHAMTHKLGFDEGFLDIDQEDVTAYPTSDYLRLVLSHSLPHLPGTHRQYSDAAYYLLSRVVSRVAGEKVDSLLLRHLFLPMEFREVAWSRCPRGYPIGTTGLYISSADMVKLGALYLDGGVYGGQRLISQEWVDKVIANEYEFSMMCPGGLIGKSGLYGQGVAFSREANFAVAWHGHISREQSPALIGYFDRISR